MRKSRNMSREAGGCGGEAPVPNLIERSSYLAGQVLPHSIRRGKEYGLVRSLYSRALRSILNLIAKQIIKLSSYSRKKSGPAFQIRPHQSECYL